MSELCDNCGHAKSLHPPWCHDPYIPGTCNFQYDLCSCKEFKSKTTLGVPLVVNETVPQGVIEIRNVTITERTKGPASEKNMDDWCVDCGHHKSLHHLNPSERICKYWTDLCECKGFISRSEAIAAVNILTNNVGI